MNEENNNTEKQRDVIYLVVNDDIIAIASAHWKLEDAKKEVEDWHKNQPQSQFMVVEIKISQAMYTEIAGAISGILTIVFFIFIIYQLKQE